MKVSQNADTAGRRLWFRRFAGGSCVLLITLIAVACVVLTSEKLRFSALRHLARHGMLSGEYSKAIDGDILNGGQMSYDLIAAGDIYDHKAVMRRVRYFVESYDPNVSRRANDLSQTLLSLHLNSTSSIRSWALTLAMSSELLSKANHMQIAYFLKNGSAREQIVALQSLLPITTNHAAIEEDLNRMLASDDDALIIECLRVLETTRNRPHIARECVERLLVSTNTLIRKRSA